MTDKGLGIKKMKKLTNLAMAMSEEEIKDADQLINQLAILVTK